MIRFNQFQTKEINRISYDYSYPLRHIWHEDNGWQKNIILNKAVEAADGQYLIFVDGDCIPEKHFVEDHYRNRAENTLLTGRRVKLSEKISVTLTTQRVSSGFLDRRLFSAVSNDALFGETKHIEKGFRFGGLINQVILRSNPKREVLGCNFSLHKKDLLGINGFDERYKGPGIGEDIDIDLRFTNNGGHIKLFKFGAIQYHVYHPILNRYDKANNLKIFEENKTNQVTATQYGIA